STENKIAQQTSFHLNSNTKLVDLFLDIEGSLSFLEFINSKCPITDDDFFTIKKINCRFLCSAGCCLSLLAKGYYQNAIFMLRDLIEIAFLIDKFRLDGSSISRWKSAKTKKELMEFRPASIRNFLDKSDGYNSNKRQYIYSIYCTYGAHVTNDGFIILCKNKMMQHGPFFDSKKFEASIVDLRKVLLY